MEQNTWGWVVGIIAVLLIIGGVWWWVADSSPTGTSNDMASSTIATTSTTGTGSAVTVVNKNSESVAAIVASLSGASQYAALFSNTAVGATLTGKGPYTVFVSSDAGYALLKPGTISSMTAAQKKRMVQYSIVTGKALNVNAVDSGAVQALSGDELNFSVGSTGLVQVNSSYVVQEYKANNGIVYVINQPLLPPTSKNTLTP